MPSRALVAQVVKFLISGGVAAAANIGVGFVLRLLLRGPSAVPVSVVCGFAVGTLVSFFLNRTITFAATSGNATRQLVRFVLAAVVGAGIAAAIASGALFVLRASPLASLSEQVLETSAHVFAVGLTTIYNFIAMKYFALKVGPAAPAPGGAEAHS